MRSVCSGWDLGLGEHSVQKFDQLVVAVDFVLTRHRQRESFSFLHRQFQGEREFFRLSVCRNHGGSTRKPSDFIGNG